MTKKMKYYLILLLAHYLFFPFYLGFVSNAVQQLVIFGCLAFYSFIRFNEIKALFNGLGRQRSVFLLSAILYLIVLAASFFIPILYGTNDFSYLSVHIRYLVYMFSYIVLLAMIRSHVEAKNLKDEVLNIFTIATRNYVIFTIFMVLIEPFKNMWISLIHETPRRLELLERPSYFARIGWAGYSGFSVTFYCTLAALFAIYLSLKAMENKEKSPVKHLVSLLFALIGNAFYGRAGLLSSLALVGFGILYIIVVNKKFHYAVILLLGIIGVFFFLSILQQFNNTLANWYDWMMQPIMSIFSTGRIQTTSTDALWTMWFIPDLPMLLLGNGFYTSPISGNYYMGTDVGFIRPTLFFGLGFLLISYAIPILMNISIGQNTRINRLFSFMMIFTMFVFEVKAEVVILLIPLMALIYLAEFAKPAPKHFKQANDLSTAALKSFN